MRLFCSPHYWSFVELHLSPEVYEVPYLVPTDDFIARLTGPANEDREGWLYCT